MVTNLYDIFTHDMWFTDKWCNTISLDPVPVFQGISLHVNVMNLDVRKCLEWCTRCVGRRHETWTYHDVNEWRFAHEQDALLFALVFEVGT